MTPEVEKIVRRAIVKTTLMREADIAIADAEYALKHGVAKPVQGEFPL